MDSVALMLFTQHVFHLECLLFHIKSQPGVSYRSVDIIKPLMLFFGLLKIKK